MDSINSAALSTESANEEWEIREWPECEVVVFGPGHPTRQSLRFGHPSTADASSNYLLRCWTTSPQTHSISWPVSPGNQ